MGGSPGTFEALIRRCGMDATPSVLLGRRDCHGDFASPNTASSTRGETDEYMWHVHNAGEGKELG